MRGMLIGLLVLAGLPAPGLAEEPLLLRIRPVDVIARELGTGMGPSEAELAANAQARAAQEAFWERSERRARIAIASVCTGCLKAPAPVSSPALASSVPSRIEPAPAKDASAAGLAGTAPLSLADSR